MVFSSLTFLFLYLPIVCIAYYCVPLKFRNLVLFVVSLFFYAWGEPKYVWIMIGSILLNYGFGFVIENAQDEQKKKMLMICLAINISLLVFFKYWDFIAMNLQNIGLSFVPVLHLALPIGISFYTFQAMSYPIDLYRKEISLQKNPVSFGTYVTMFPQLIAGPIVRYKDIESQLQKRTHSIDHFAQGIERFTVGLCKKVLLANSCGAVWEAINTIVATDTSVVTAWLGMICYTLQIYFDFSGYSDMAIGLGKMFGFDFLENFNYPYIAKSITDFWRRWHMSLSYWFRDYVYIPLGGNRNGLKRQIINIMIVWLLTGLWHGASWNFVLWGILYGCILILEKVFLLKYLEKAPSFVQHLYTLLIVNFLWVIFAKIDIMDGLHYISMLFGNASSFVNHTTWFYLRNNIVLLLISILACTPLAKTKYNPFQQERFKQWKPLFIAIGLLLCITFIVDGTYNPFLYFRF